MSGSKSRSGSASKGGDGRRSFAESLDNRRKAYKVLHRVAYPRSITMGLQDYDAYKVATEAVFGSLLNVAQSNPAYRVSSGSGLRLTPPDGQEPIRALHDALKKNIFSVEASTETWKGLKAQLDEHDEILERLFKEQHKFYVAGEPMLKKVHFFIYKIVPDFEAARAGMDKSRDNYDAAQNIYDVASDNAKIEALAALKLAGEEFKKQMADVLRLIGIISGLKPAHLKEIEEFVGLFFESDRAMMKSLKAPKKK